MNLQEILSQLKGQTIESIDYVEEESSPNDLGFLQLKTTEGKIFEFRPYLDPVSEEIPVIGVTFTPPIIP